MLLQPCCIIIMIPADSHKVVVVMMDVLVDKVDEEADKEAEEEEE